MKKTLLLIIMALFSLSMMARTVTINLASSPKIQRRDSVVWQSGNVCVSLKKHQSKTSAYISLGADNDEPFTTVYEDQRIEIYTTDGAYLESAKINAYTEHPAEPPASQVEFSQTYGCYAKTEEFYTMLTTVGRNISYYWATVASYDADITTIEVTLVPDQEEIALRNDILELKTKADSLYTRVRNELDSMRVKYPHVADKYVERAGTIINEASKFLYETMPTVQTASEYRTALNTYYDLEYNLDSLLQEMKSDEEAAINQGNQQMADERMYRELYLQIQEVRDSLDYANRTVCDSTKYDMEVVYEMRKEVIALYESLDSVEYTVTHEYKMGNIAQYNDWAMSELEELMANVRNLRLLAEKMQNELNAIKELDDRIYNAMMQDLADVNNKFYEVLISICDTTQYSENIAQAMSARFNAVENDIETLRTMINDAHRNGNLLDYHNTVGMSISLIYDELESIVRDANEMRDKGNENEEDEKKQMAEAYFVKLNGLLQSYENKWQDINQKLLNEFNNATYMMFEARINNIAAQYRSIRAMALDEVEDGRIIDNISYWIDYATRYDNELDRIYEEAKQYAGIADMEADMKGYAEKLHMTEKYTTTKIEEVLAYFENFTANNPMFASVLQEMSAKTYDTYDQIVRKGESTIEQWTMSLNTLKYGNNEGSNNITASDSIDTEAIYADITLYKNTIEECIAQLNEAAEALDKFVASAGITYAACMKEDSQIDLETIASLASNTSFIDNDAIATMIGEILSPNGDASYSLTESAKAYLMSAGTVIAESVNISAFRTGVSVMFNPTSQDAAPSRARRKALGNKIEVHFAPNSFVKNGVPVETELTTDDPTFKPENLVKLDETEIDMIIELANDEESKFMTEQALSIAHVAEMKAENEIAEQVMNNEKVEKSYNSFLTTAVRCDSKYNEAYNMIMNIDFRSDLQYTYRDRLDNVVSTLWYDKYEAQNAYDSKSLDVIENAAKRVRGIIESIEEILEEACIANGTDLDAIEDIATATEAASKDGKFLENGKLIIRKNGKTYNIAGQKAK